MSLFQTEKFSDKNVGFLVIFNDFAYFRIVLIVNILSDY